MVSALTPDWIKNLKDKADKASTDAAASTALTQVAHLKIQRDAPIFWKDLLVQLHINAESLPELGEVRGTLSSDLGSYQESSCRLEVVTGSQIPKINHIDLFYRPGTGYIHCLTLQGKAFVFSFCLDDAQNVVVLEKSDFKLMNAAQMAQFITEIILGLSKG